MSNKRTREEELEEANKRYVNFLPHPHCTKKLGAALPLHTTESLDSGVYPQSTIEESKTITVLEAAPGDPGVSQARYLVEVYRAGTKHDVLRVPNTWAKANVVTVDHDMVPGTPVHAYTRAEQNITSERTELILNPRSKNGSRSEEDDETMGTPPKQNPSPRREEQARRSPSPRRDVPPPVHQDQQTEDTFRRMINSRETTPMPAPITVSANFYWAPYKRDTKCTCMAFLTWVKKLTPRRMLGVIWPSVTCTEDGRIKLVVKSDGAIKALVDNLNILSDGEWVRITWPGDRNTAKTVERFADHMEPSYCAPLIITPLVPETQLFKVVEAFHEGENKYFGPVTGLTRLPMNTAFVGQVWEPERRAQILRNPFTAEMAKFVPMDPPPGMIDLTAILVFNDGIPCSTDKIATILGAIEEGHGPKAYAQYVDIENDIEQQKWLVAFNFARDAYAYIRDRQNFIEDAKKFDIELRITTCRGIKPKGPKEGIVTTRGRGRTLPTRGRGK